MFPIFTPFRIKEFDQTWWVGGRYQALEATWAWIEWMEKRRSYYGFSVTLGLALGLPLGLAKNQELGSRVNGP